MGRILQMSFPAARQVTAKYITDHMVDIGVPYSIVKQYENDIQIVLLTHVHKDHIQLETLKRLCRNRPTIRIGCGSWMLELLEGFKNVDVFDFGKWYNYGTFRLAIGKAITMCQIAFIV